jgi:hypothetical protein
MQEDLPALSVKRRPGDRSQVDLLAPAENQDLLPACLVRMLLCRVASDL